MEFAFVRNGREEADREKIRAFAEAYGLVPCGEQTGANIGEAMAGNYAGERPEKAAGRPGRTGGMRPEKAAGRPGRGDTMIVADAAALGSRYEEALQAVSLAARQGISLYCVKEGLRQGLAKAEIARRLGVGRTTLYLYLKKNEDAGLRTGTDGAGRAGAGKNGGSGAGAGRGVAAGTGREVAAGADRGEIGLQANKAIYDRSRT